jgi:hypothetical protein
MDHVTKIKTKFHEYSLKKKSLLKWQSFMNIQTSIEENAFWNAQMYVLKVIL